MRNIVLIIMLFFFFRTEFCLDVCAADNDKTLKGSIVITSIGQELDPNLVKRVALFIKDNVAIDVRFEKSDFADMEASLEEHARLLSGHIRKDESGLLALVNVPKDGRFHGGVFKSARVAFLNVWLLLPDKSGKESSNEKYSRRIEKESMRLTGLLFGLETCPMPFCAMSSALNQDELDAKGRNYCPPCEAKMEKILGGQ